MGANVVSSWKQVVRLLQDGTKNPESCADASLNNRVGTLVDKLQFLPSTPRSVWKTLLQQQVPLHIAIAFSAAAQHSPKSPGMIAALMALEVLLETATTSALIKDGAAAGSLAISIRQQLQQAGVLQQLAGAMAMLAADMRRGAAMSQEQLRVHLSCCTVNNTAMLLDLPCMACLHLSRLHRLLRNLWRSPGQHDSASSVAWVSDPSGYPEAAMQLCTAVLQHVSSVLQHVLPDMQGQLVAGQQATFTAVMELGRDVVAGVCDWNAHFDGLFGAHQEILTSTVASLDAQAQQRLQQLLLSPYCLPFMASQLLLTVAWFSTTLAPAARDRNSNATPGSSSSSSSSSSSRSGSRTVGTTRQQGRQQRAAQAATSSTREGAQQQVGGDSPLTPLTPCQRKLLELLGVSPQLTVMMEPALSPALSSHNDRVWRVSSTVLACRCSCYVLNEMLCSPGGKQQVVADLQRWQFEQQLWLLLPAVLLPCAGKLWPQGTGTPEDRVQGRFDETTAMQLLFMCTHAQIAANNLHVHIEQHLVEIRLPHPAWSQEVLVGALQLADQLLLQQGWHGQAAGSTPSSSHTSSSSSSLSSNLAGQGSVAQEVLGLLVQSLSVFNTSAASSLRLHLLTRTGTRFSPGDAVVLSGSQSTGLELQLAKSPLIQLHTVAEAGLRLITTAIQQGAMQPPHNTLASALQWLVGISGGAARSMVNIHSGVDRGLEVLGKEQRQLYTVQGLLTTLQKLSKLQKLGNQAGAASPELCWGQQVANRCCWEVGEEAADLMKTVMMLAGSAAAPAAAVDQLAGAAPAAVEGHGQQLPEVEFLPSLVLLGRCCMVWAEQLRQQAPKLMLLLGTEANTVGQQQQQEEQQGGVQAEHSAAWVCIPGVQEGGASVSAQPCGLEKLLATVSSWVGVSTAPVVRTALAAAAGGGPQHFRQQLDALSAAQAAVRQEGVNDASLSALVQQLQVTGGMLSSFAVPHFCNNPACLNISGPTEVQLVSGRSCICAGCHTARYCGRGCQRQAWKQHKAVCKALAAAAAAAAGTPG